MEEEFDSLFDYSKTVSAQPIYLDDSSDDDVIIASAPKRSSGILQSKVPLKASVSTAKSASSMNVTELDDDDDDWLSLPPTLPKLATPVVSSGDRTVQQLRMKRDELLNIETRTSPGFLRRVEEMARMQVQRQRVPDPPIVPSTPPQILKPQLQPESETFGSREKILLKVQNKNGSAQSIRIYSSDKFEKLFSAYAKLVGASPSAFSFRFDGDQLSPSSTPKELDLENDDIIEVYDKSPQKS